MRGVSLSFCCLSANMDRRERAYGRSRAAICPEPGGNMEGEEGGKCKASGGFETDVCAFRCRFLLWLLSREAENSVSLSVKFKNGKS